MKVLFLDVDGVLNRGSGPIEHELANLVNDAVIRAELNVVVSSAWRVWEGDLNRVRAAIHNVIDRTIDGKLHKDYNTNRAMEIQEWLGRHKVEQFAVLDDLAIPIENLFRTHEWTGITKVIKKKLIKHFDSTFVDSDDVFQNELDDAKGKGWV